MFVEEMIYDIKYTGYSSSSLILNVPKMIIW